MKLQILFLTTAIFFALSGNNAFSDFKFLPIVDANVLGSYSQFTSDTRSTFGLDGMVTVVPAMKFGNENFLMPTYVFESANQGRQLEEEGKLYIASQSHLGSLIFKRVLTPAFSAKFRFDAKFDLIKETRDETWGKGLYDSRNYGGGLEAEYKIIDEEAGTEKPIFLGFKFYRAYYPNYTSTVSDLAKIFPEILRSDVPETYVKDYDGLRFYLNYKDNLLKMLPMNVMYGMIAKSFREKHLWLETGELDVNKKRVDLINTASLDMDVLLSQMLIPKLGVEFFHNYSNQNYRDWLGTLDRADDMYMDSYFTFWYLRFTPGVLFTFNILDRPFDIFAAYTFLLRNYPNRVIQDVDGNYSKDKIKQSDIEQKIYGSLSYQIIKTDPGQDNYAGNFWITSSGDYTFTSSNMKYERYFKYNYNLFHVRLGVKYAY